MLFFLANCLATGEKTTENSEFQAGIEPTAAVHTGPMLTERRGY